MNKTTHIIGGVTAGIAVNQYIVPKITATSTPESFIGVASVMAGAFLGSVLPDIDHKNSFIGRRLKVISFALHHTVGHRGLTHSPLFIIALSTILSLFVLQLSGFTKLISFLFVLGLFFGMLSHLIMDSLTKGGIPLLYPFSKKHYSIGKFKTGGIGEYIASFACILVIIMILQNSSLLFLQ